MIAPVVEIRFADARRPEDATHVRTETFDGPIALLLALIEQRQLDVLTVRLGDLAGAYLDALAGIERGRLPLLSSFVTVCSQLILIKSRALLPRPPQAAPADDGQNEPDPEEELRRRLIEYRMFRDAGRALAAMLEGGLPLFHREAAVALAAGKAGARPDEGPPLEPGSLADALVASVRLVPPTPPPAEIVARTITLDERTAVIRSALRRAPQIVLQDLLSNVTDRIVVAVTFLALLELAKGREVVIEQDEPWGPIRVTPRVDASAEASEVAARWMTASLRSRSCPRTSQASRHAAAVTAAHIEALLFVAERPLTRREMASARRGRSRDGRRVARRSRGVAPRARPAPRSRGRRSPTRHRARGRFADRALHGCRGRRSCRPRALETLAIVAYRQPVTRGAIERIRGVDSDYVLRTLLHRRLVDRAGSCRHAGPAHPVRHRLRLPRALRHDVARRPAAARCRRPRSASLSEGVRIHKALADAGVASRRKAEQLVIEGRVTVNGAAAGVGQLVDPARDVLAVDGRASPRRSGAFIWPWPSPPA